MKKLLLTALLLTACSNTSVQNAETLDQVLVTGKDGAVVEESSTSGDEENKDSKRIYASADPLPSGENGYAFVSSMFNVIYDCTEVHCSVEFQNPDETPLLCPEEVRCGKEENYGDEIQKISTPGLQKLIYGLNTLNGSGDPTTTYSELKMLDLKTGETQSLLQFPSEGTFLIINSWSPDLSKLAVVAYNYNAYGDSPYPNNSALFILNFNGDTFMDSDFFDIAIALDVKPGQTAPAYPFHVSWLNNDEIEYQTPATSGNIYSVPYTLNVSTGKIYASK